MSLLAWRLRLLKNIFLLRMCISSIVMSKEATLVPMIELYKNHVGQFINIAWMAKTDMLLCCTLQKDEIPDSVVVELQQVGQLVKQDGTWLCHNDLFNPNLRDRSITHRLYEYMIRKWQYTDSGFLNIVLNLCGYSLLAACRHPQWCVQPPPACSPPHLMTEEHTHSQGYLRSNTSTLLRVSWI